MTFKVQKKFCELLIKGLRHTIHCFNMLIDAKSILCSQLIKGWNYILLKYRQTCNFKPFHTPATSFSLSSTLDFAVIFLLLLNISANTSQLSSGNSRQRQRQTSTKKKNLYVKVLQPFYKAVIDGKRVHLLSFACRWMKISWKV